MLTHSRFVLLITWLISALFLTALSAQAAPDDLMASCRFEGAKCGYVDSAGKTVIAPQLDAAERFHDGRAKVRLAGLYGFIDETGEVIVPFAYDQVSRYWSGFAQVRKDGRTKLIDRQGKVIVPARYDYIIPLDQRHFLVGERQNHRDHIRLIFRGPLLPSRVNWSLLNVSTEATTNLGRGEILLFSDGPKAKFWQKRQGTYALIDTNGNPLADGFDHVQMLRYDRAIVGRGGRRGAVDGSGKLVVPLAFDNVSYFDKDKWTVFKRNRKHGYIDRNGKVMIAARFDQAYRFEGETARVKLGADWLKIDRSGKLLAARETCPDGLKRVRRGDQFVIAGTDGKPINEETYARVTLKCGSPARVAKARGQYGFVAKDGRLLTGRYFAQVLPFFEGVAAVRPTRDTLGIIDVDGRFLVEPVQTKARVFTSGGGRTGFEINWDWILLDRALALELAKDPSRLTAEPSAWSGCRRDGVKITKTGRRFVYSDALGKPFIAGDYDYATCFNRGMAWVAVQERQKWCQIDKSGTLFEDTCRCSQPVFSVFAPKPRPQDVSCYEHGLAKVRKMLKRR